MAFHRYTTPTYTGGMPVGYDLFNVVSGGTGGGGSANADSAKVGGPNAGTYMVAFGEDASSLNANRGLKALAQNTDTLDDQLRRDMAVVVKTNTVVAGAPVTSITLPAGTYLGNSNYTVSTFDLNRLFRIVNDQGLGLSWVTSVTLGSGDQIGGGGANGKFSGNTVQLNLSPAVPAGVSYRVIYGSRSNLATMGEDGIFGMQVFGAQYLDQTVTSLFLDLHGGVGAAWDDTWFSTIYDLGMRGLDGTLRAAGVADVTGPEAYFDDVLGLPRGSWFLSDGPAVTGYSGTVNYGDPYGAIFAQKFRTPIGSAPIGALSGFVSFGARPKYTAVANEQTYEAGTTHFMALQGHYHAAGISSSIYTHIPVNAGCTLATSNTDPNVGDSEVTLTGGSDFFRNGGNSAVSAGQTLLELTYTQSATVKRRTVVITALDGVDPKKAKVRNLDNTIPNFTGATGASVIAWHTPLFFIGDGKPSQHALVHSITDPVRIDGLQYSAAPKLGVSGGTEIAADGGTTAASFYAAASSEFILRWGYRQATTPWQLAVTGYIKGDGTLTTPVVRVQALNFLYGQPNTIDADDPVGILLTSSGAPPTASRAVTGVAISDLNALWFPFSNSMAVGRYYIFPLTELPSGCTITGVSIVHNPDNATAPLTKVKLSILRIPADGSGAVEAVTAVEDPAVGAGYTAPHTFTATFGTPLVVSLADSYYVKVISETGGSAVPGVLASQPTILYTVNNLDLLK